MTRESWLVELAKKQEPLFKVISRVAPYRISCGWPCKNALGTKSKRIGECHPVESSADKVHEIFISPVLEKPIEVAGVVCHELAHIVSGLGAAHGKRFVATCNAVGLTKGKPTSAGPGDRLKEKLLGLLEGMGDYPHKALNPVMVQVKKESSVTKLECADCDCAVTISKRLLEECGAPTCACGGKMV